MNVVALIVVLAGLAPAGATTPPRPARILAPNDCIHINVQGGDEEREKDFDGDYTIDPDGNINMLYINQVHVGGLTTSQAAPVILHAIRNAGRWWWLPRRVTVTLLRPVTQPERCSNRGHRQHLAASLAQCLSQ